MTEPASGKETDCATDRAPDWATDRAQEWAADWAGDAAWCAADPHFGADDPAVGVFLRWLDAFVRGGPRDLVLLGDMFDVWVGLPASQTEEQRTILGVLGAVVKGGRRVVYLRGNRDYFIEGPLAEAGILLRDQWDLETAGGVIHFEHGDLINSSDHAYLRWREISRSGSVGALFRRLSPARQRAIAQKLRKSMSGTNSYFKAYRPERELDRWARALAAGGTKTAILGHFHLDESVEIAGVLVRFVPQFREDAAFLRIRKDGTTILQRGLNPLKPDEG